MLGHTAISEAPLSAGATSSPARGAAGVWRRARAYWGRVWRYLTMGLPAQSITVAASDDRDYLFDLSDCPEIRAGAEISAAPGDIAIEGAGALAVGTPAPTSTTIDGIAAGQAVIVRISGWTAGTSYALAARVKLTSGRTVVVPGRAIAATDTP